MNRSYKDEEFQFEVISKLERIVDFISSLTPQQEGESSEIWLDSNETARLLRISSRTLQRLRTDNQISYTMIRGKCLYKRSDIEKALNDRVISTCSIEDFRKRFLHDGTK